LAHGAPDARREALAHALGAALGGQVVDLRRPSGGASRQTWSFDLDQGGAPRPLILQLERAPGVSPAGHMKIEADLLAAAARGGVPVAPLVASGEDDGLGAPWICVERMAGETIPRKLLRDEEYRSARPRITAQAATALARIHAIPLESCGPLADTDQLAEFTDLLHALRQPRPALELGARWLRATQPADIDHTLVHGDFRTGNLLVDAEGLVAVLDWELAHAGDPREDLGWFCVRAWRFGSAGRAGGFGDLEELLTAYQAAGGTSVDAEGVLWFEALGTIKRAVMCIVQAASHLSGMSRSVELATIGRRVCENEWDLLSLIGATKDLPAAVPPPPRAARTPFGRPTAAELTEAVDEFLTNEVMAVEGRLGFQARIAANALRIVQRELQWGPEFAERHGRRLALLGFPDDASLAEAIARGEFDDRIDEVAPLIAEGVREQLLVANPRHLEEK
jgi:aminoglycoside phosphotransferase (APT) family kinase protein